MYLNSITSQSSYVYERELYHKYSEMPRLSLVDKARAIGQIQAAIGYTKKWMVEFVYGVDQDNVLLGQHAVQA